MSESVAVTVSTLPSCSLGLGPPSGRGAEPADERPMALPAQGRGGMCMC
jgi:hypothetical protein